MEFSELGEVDGIELLQKLPIFSLLTFDETSRLGKIAQHEQLDEGVSVIEQDELGEALYIIIEGEVVVTRGEKDENPDEELGKLSAGEIFGEMSLVDNLLTSDNVITTKACQMLKLPRNEFQEILESDAKLALKIYRSFCRVLSDRLRQVNDLLAGDQVFSIVVR